DEREPRTVTPNPVVKAHETPRGNAETTPVPVPAEQAEEAEAKEKKADPMMNFLKAASPLMKRSAERNAKEKAAALAKLLNLAPHRAKQLEELMDKHALKKDVKMQPLFDGGELDPADLMELRESEDGIPVGLERDLATVLNGNEVDQVKEHYREEKERKLEARVESEFEGLALTDLTEEQRVRLREVLRAEATDESAKKDQMPMSAKGLKEMMSEKGLVTQLEKRYAARREKLAGFLSSEQLAQADKMHKAELEDAKAAMSIFGGFLAAPQSVTVKPK
ncbi:MAG: hypothetical protein O7E54_13695, partial [Planctomycetota bacterium]|nr:hypothetical protein [Planctomycetota bacterium]